MSTKIYNAYISDLNCEQLLEKFKLIKPETEKVKTKHLLENFIKKVVRKIDKKEIEYKENTFDLLYDEIDILTAKNRELYIKNRKNYDFDFELLVMLFPLNNKTLLMFFGNPKLMGIATNQDFFKDYHYQTSTDKPKNISKKEWTKRSKDWDTVLGGDGYSTPAECVLQYTFCNSDGLNFMDLMENDLNQFIPDNENRAFDLFEQKYYANCKDFSEYFHKQDMLQEYMETENYFYEIKEIKDNLIKIDFSKQ